MLGTLESEKEYFFSSNSFKVNQCLSFFGVGLASFTSFFLSFAECGLTFFTCKWELRCIPKPLLKRHQKTSKVSLKIWHTACIFIKNESNNQINIKTIKHDTKQGQWHAYSWNLWKCGGREHTWTMSWAQKWGTRLAQ